METLRPSPPSLSSVSLKPSKSPPSHSVSCRNRSTSNGKRGVSAAESKRQSAEISDAGFENGGLMRSIGRFALGFAAAASVWCGDGDAIAESLAVAFPVSHTTEVNTVQRTLIEAWGLIRETFVDPTFNHRDWDLKLQQTMVEMFPLKSADAAYNKIKGMLSTLGDPFTRIISPKSFRIGSGGNLQGVGLFINDDPATGHLIVMPCVEDSPASRASIHEGDKLVEINGEGLDGVDSETAARKLRGRAGTTVRVTVRIELLILKLCYPSENDGDTSSSIL